MNGRQYSLGGRAIAAPSGNGRTSTGFSNPADDYASGRIDLHELLVGNEDATTLVMFDSDAMVGIGILKGNLLVVDRSLDPKDGSIVQAVVDGEILVRFLRLSTSRPILEASNPSYPSIELTNRDDIEIMGVITFNIAAFR